MYKVTKWYAEDGTMFDDESDCCNYELEQQLDEIKGQYLMLTADFREVNDPIVNFDNVAFIYTKTDCATEILHEVLKEDWSTPWDYESETAGAWFYSKESDRWMDLEGAMEWMKKVLNHLPAWFRRDDSFSF